MANTSMKCFNVTYFSEENISQVGDKTFLQGEDKISVICPESSSSMDYKAVLIWNILYSFMILTAVLGNCAVLWIVIQNRKMRTVTNLFIFNLSMADLINTTFNSIFNYIFMKNKDWSFGAIFCRVTNFMTHMSIVAAVLTIAAIAVER